MSKFTPGPWRFEVVGIRGPYDNPVDVYEITNGYTTIAEFMNGNDARLIAAAPELYEIVTRYAATADNPLAMGDIAEIDHDARALLAKIDGDA